MSDDELMLALHGLMERVEGEHNCGATAAAQRMMECLDIVADERGAFQDEEIGKDR